MRKKAERDIRRAAARLDEGPPHRIDSPVPFPLLGLFRLSLFIQKTCHKFY